jgi:hypothetical protein
MATTIYAVRGGDIGEGISSDSTRCPSTRNRTLAAPLREARGSITGAGTFLGGVLHTLPFLLTVRDSAPARRAAA